jgi:hypothetical protein
MPMKKELSYGTLMQVAFDDDDEGTDHISKDGVIHVMSKVESTFPGAFTTHQLSNQLACLLSQYGYTKKTTLLGTSFCCDEVNRGLEDELRQNFDDNFSIGGLCGFPFGGLTSFGTMVHHMPQDGSLVIVYAPHVGIDWDANVGKTNRRGHLGSGACCGPAQAAMHYVRMVRSGEREEADVPDSILDAQQIWIQKSLLKYGDQLERAEVPNVELMHALLDCQTKLIDDIIQKGCRELKPNSKIALVGGIQINTPEGTADYFLPKRFDLVNHKGEITTSLLSLLQKDVHNHNVGW